MVGDIFWVGGAGWTFLLLGGDRWGFAGIFYRWMGVSGVDGGIFWVGRGVGEGIFWVVGGGWTFFIGGWGWVEVYFGWVELSGRE